jgi:MATE family multidrug resistance protein
LVALACGVVNLVFIVSVGHVWASAFTSDPDVRASVADIIWILSIFSVFDFIQCVLSGVLRGLGKQKVGATTNLIAWWVVSLPAAFVFGRVLGGGLLGIWMGAMAGVVVQAVVMAAYLLRMDWPTVVAAAAQREAAGRVSAAASIGGGADEDAGVELTGGPARGGRLHSRSSSEADVELPPPRGYALTAPESDDDGDEEIVFVSAAVTPAHE